MYKILLTESSICFVLFFFSPHVKSFFLSFWTFLFPIFLRLNSKNSLLFEGQIWCFLRFLPKFWCSFVNILWKPKLSRKGLLYCQQCKRTHAAIFRNISFRHKMGKTKINLILFGNGLCMCGQCGPWTNNN